MCTGPPIGAGPSIATVIGEPAFEEADRRIRSNRRRGGIESEIIQCAPANRVGVRILCKGL
jgi:hypothetical protein